LLAPGPRIVRNKENDRWNFDIINERSRGIVVVFNSISCPMCSGLKPSQIGGERGHLVLKEEFEGDYLMECGVCGFIAHFIKK
jgi:hypothetical protein